MTEWSVVDFNLQECFRALALGREKAETRRIGGVNVLSLGVRFQMFNAAYLAAPVDSETALERSLATAAVHFAARGLEWSFWLCDSLLPEPVNRRAQRIMARQGLTLATRMPGMITASLESPVRPLPACHVREVTEAGLLRDFCEVGSRCFRVPQPWFEEVFDAGLPQRLPFRAWVGYERGLAVSTAATVVHDGALGIYNVATLPGSRGRGYGEAIVREAAAREFAVHGTLPLVLQSTALGLALYERMGFQTVTQFRVWVS